MAYWANQGRTPFEAAAICRGDIDASSHFLINAGCVAYCTNTEAMESAISAPTNWEEMKTACSSSGTVTLSDAFVMGTYTPTPWWPQLGGIDFSGKQLVLIGNNKTLDAGQKGRFFYSGPSGGSSLSLLGVTVRNGNSVVHGGAILMHSGSLVIHDSTFIANTANNNGGAIHMQSGSLVIHDSTFDTNTAASLGGALRVTESDVTIYTSTFVSNSADIGGAIDFWKGGNVQIYGTSFISNEATALG
jgi:predicted outer membrane repeat protein